MSVYVDAGDIHAIWQTSTWICIYIHIIEGKWIVSHNTFFWNASYFRMQMHINSWVLIVKNKQSFIHLQVLKCMKRLWWHFIDIFHKLSVLLTLWKDTDSVKSVGQRKTETIVKILSTFSKSAIQFARSKLNRWLAIKETLLQYS